MEWVIHAILRFLQFVFAITVAGLYGTDIDHARKRGGGGDSRWVSEVLVMGELVTEAISPGVCGGCCGPVRLDLSHLHGPSAEIVLPLCLGHCTVVSASSFSQRFETDTDDNVLASCG